VNAGQHGLPKSAPIASRHKAGQHQTKPIQKGTERHGELQLGVGKVASTRASGPMRSTAIKHSNSLLPWHSSVIDNSPHTGLSFSKGHHQQSPRSSEAAGRPPAIGTQPGRAVADQGVPQNPRQPINAHRPAERGLRASKPSFHDERSKAAGCRCFHGAKTCLQLFLNPLRRHFTFLWCSRSSNFQVLLLRLQAWG
jgi:hypothetical protein